MTQELAIVKKPELVIAAKQKRRAELLAFPQVNQVLNETDQLVVKSSLKPTICEIENEVLNEKVGIIIEFVGKDLGISQVNDKHQMKYAATRFVGMLKRHYKELTVQDIKLAFEFLEVGKLDAYLPKDKHGEPDREHYQLFNVKFYTKVLNAYLRVKSKVWGKAERALGKHEALLMQQIPKEERERNQKAFFEEIYQAFDVYKDKGVEPKFVFSIFIKEMVKQGLVKMPKPTKKQIETAYNKVLLNSRLPRTERKSIIETYAAGGVPNLVQHEAQIIANNQRIKSCFDRLIKSKTNIKDVLKNGREHED